MKEDFQKRAEEIFKLRHQGKKFKHIASLYDISVARAGQIYQREKEKHDNADKWPPLKKLLSTRTKTCLINHYSYLGYEDILNNPKKIAESNKKELLKIKNLGKKSVKELLIVLHELGYISQESLLNNLNM